MSLKSVENEISKKEFDILVAKYNLAIEEKKESFLFFGNELLVDYAKYLIESLADKNLK